MRRFQCMSGAGNVGRRRAVRPRVDALEARSLLSAAPSPLISEFLASNGQGLQAGDGSRPDWIEVYNPGGSAVDLSGWSLTDDASKPSKWTFPASTTLAAGGFLVVFASDRNQVSGGERHTNFKLSADGEYLALSRPDGTVAHAFAPEFPAQSADISYGLVFGSDGKVSAGREPRYFATPTPGAANVETARSVVEPVEASVPHGFYDAPMLVSLTTATPDATIRYTRDGSVPTLSHGEVYEGPIAVDRTTTLRASAFKTGYVDASVATETYLFLDDVIRQSANGQAPAGWPATWGSHVVDYGMDPDVVNSAEYGGARLKSALQAIPTISITTDLANLFDPATGFYANSTKEGREWERPVSLELIHADGSPGFQIDAGARIRGGHSATNKNPKHSLRLFFRDEYGRKSLDYPMFGAEGVDSFRKLDLRTAQNYSWSMYGSADNNFVTEVFARDSMRDLGQPYTRSRFYHVYINGQYWGLYQSEERPDADFAASYFGGDADHYDVIRDDLAGVGTKATDGNLEAWRRLWQAVSAGAWRGTDAQYLRLLGKNPDGTDNPSYEVLVNPDNLIDYMMVNLYIGNEDGPISKMTGNKGPNNFFAIRDRTGREGFRFIMRDAEHSLLHVNENRNGPYRVGERFEEFNPQYLHQQLMRSALYRKQFNAHVREHMFDSGALTPTASLRRFQSRAVEISEAIVGESARWGDAQRPTAPLTRAEWLGAVRRVTQQILPFRTTIAADQFRARGLFTDPVVLRVVGGSRGPDGRLTVTLSASGPLQASSAARRTNYALVAPGRDGRFGTRDDRAMPLERVSYEPRMHTITVRFRPLAALGGGRQLRLQARGAGLRELSGRWLDGDRDGRPGGNFDVFIPYV